MTLVGSQDCETINYACVLVVISGEIDMIVFERQDFELCDDDIIIIHVFVPISCPLHIIGLTVLEVLFAFDTSVVFQDSVIS